MPSSVRGLRAEVCGRELTHGRHPQPEGQGHRGRGHAPRGGADEEGRGAGLTVVVDLGVGDLLLAGLNVGLVLLLLLEGVARVGGGGARERRVALLARESQLRVGHLLALLEGGNLSENRGIYGPSLVVSLTRLDMLFLMCCSVL